VHDDRQARAPCEGREGGSRLSGCVACGAAQALTGAGPLAAVSHGVLAAFARLAKCHPSQSQRLGIKILRQQVDEYVSHIGTCEDTYMNILGFMILCVTSFTIESTTEGFGEGHRCELLNNRYRVVGVCWVRFIS